MTELTKRSTVRITHGNRSGELAKVIYVRMAPPNYSNIKAASLLCLDGRQAIYPVEQFEKVS